MCESNSLTEELFVNKVMLQFKWKIINVTNKLWVTEFRAGLSQNSVKSNTQQQRLI